MASTTKYVNWFECDITIQFLRRDPRTTLPRSQPSRTTHVISRNKRNPKNAKSKSTQSSSVLFDIKRLNYLLDNAYEFRKGLLASLPYYDVPLLATLGIKLTTQEKTNFMDPVKVLRDRFPDRDKLSQDGWTITIETHRLDTFRTGQQIATALVDPVKGLKLLDAAFNATKKRYVQVFGILKFTHPKATAETNRDPDIVLKAQKDMKNLGRGGKNRYPLLWGDGWVWRGRNFRMITSLEDMRQYTMAER